MPVSKDNQRSRQHRVQKLKKIILLVAGVLILVPVVFCIFLLFRIQSLENQMNQMTGEVSAAESEITEHAEEAAPAMHQEETDDDAGPYEHHKRKVYLTFDDGPGGETDQILDILKEHHVQATFFVTGKTDEVSIRAYQRIVAEGHTIGLHSYTHNYREIYASKEAYIEDLTRLQDYVYELTGVKTYYVRFPGGSSNQVSDVDMQELIGYLNDNGFTYYDWNISSGDADSNRMPVQRIVNNCLNKLEQMDSEAIILMHDSVDKKTTVEALPVIIEEIQQMDDTEIVPISEDTIPIQHKTITK